MSALKLTNENFSTEVLKSDIPVLVDFWAEWCGPCKMLAPMIDEVANEAGGAYKVTKMDVDECKEIAKQYGIQALPTLAIFKGGELVDRKVGGGAPKGAIKRWLADKTNA